MKQRPKICENCRWWHRAVGIDGEEKEYGECRLNPPHPFYLPDVEEGYKLMQANPTTTEGYACGQWRYKGG